MSAKNIKSTWLSSNFFTDLIWITAHLLNYLMMHFHLSCEQKKVCGYWTFCHRDWHYYHGNWQPSNGYWGEKKNKERRDYKWRPEHKEVKGKEQG